MFTEEKYVFYYELKQQKCNQFNSVKELIVGEDHERDEESDQQLNENDIKFLKSVLIELIKKCKFIRSFDLTNFQQIDN